jgi:hypothetical protein
MKKISKLQAHRYSVMKWESIVATNGHFKASLSTHLSKLKFFCGYCEKYWDTPHSILKCVNCPLNIITDIPDSTYYGACQKEGHPFDAWCENKTRETAQAVLDLINSKKPQRKSTNHKTDV